MAFKSISKSDLQVGMYVDINLSWFDHPFPSSKFLIRDSKTLKTILALKKLSDTLQYDPERSQLDAQAEPQPAPEPKALPSEAELNEEAVLREEMADARKAINRAERKVAELGNRVRHLMPNLTSGSQVALEAAADIANEVTEDLVSDPSAVMQMINVNAGDDSYFSRHAINVTAMSVMLARANGVDDELITQIGLGAFLHDLGVSRLPSSVVNKKTKLTPPEQRLYDEHTKIGDGMTRESLSSIARDIIRFHHAKWDGSGQPAIKGDEIPLGAQIVAIANRYDNLCNPRANRDPIAPAQAVKFMFSKERKHYSPKLLDSFIRCLGVYPPGTLVGLSDDQVGVVVAANPSQPLKPSVVVYDPMVERREALPLDLSAPGMPSIEKSYTLEQLPAVVGAYLALSARLNYYLVASVDSEILEAGKRLRGEVELQPNEPEIG